MVSEVSVLKGSIVHYFPNNLKIKLLAKANSMAMLRTRARIWQKRWLGQEPGLGWGKNSRARVKQELQDKN